MKQKEIMTDEEALKYAIENLEDAERLLDLPDQDRAELSEVIHTLKSLLDSYEKCSFGFLTLGDEEDAEA